MNVYNFYYSVSEAMGIKPYVTDDQEMYDDTTDTMEWADADGNPWDGWKYIDTIMPDTVNKLYFHDEYVAGRAAFHMYGENAGFYFYAASAPEDSIYGRQIISFVPVDSMHGYTLLTKDEDPLMKRFKCELDYARYQYDDTHLISFTPIVDNTSNGIATLEQGTVPVIEYPIIAQNMDWRLFVMPYTSATPEDTELVSHELSSLNEIAELSVGEYWFKAVLSNSSDRLSAYGEGGSVGDIDETNKPTFYGESLTHLIIK